jgi:hypothetical protein
MSWMNARINNHTGSRSNALFAVAKFSTAHRSQSARPVTRMRLPCVSKERLSGGACSRDLKLLRAFVFANRDHVFAKWPRGPAPVAAAGASASAMSADDDNDNGNDVERQCVVYDAPGAPPAPSALPCALSATGNVTKRVMIRRIDGDTGDDDDDDDNDDNDSSGDGEHATNVPHTTSATVDVERLASNLRFLLAFCRPIFVSAEALTALVDEQHGSFLPRGTGDESSQKLQPKKK